MSESIVDWGSVYLVQQASAINEWPKFNTTSNIGVYGTGSSGAKFVIPITNAPNLTTPVYRDRIAKHTSKSARNEKDYFLQFRGLNTITLEMPLNSYNLSLFLWLLFQNGSSETADGSNEVALFEPYTSSDPEIFCVLTRVLRAISTNRRDDYTSQTALGCVCKSITVNGVQSGVLAMTGDLVPSFITTYNTLGLIRNNYSDRLNHYPIVGGSQVTVSFLQRQAEPTTALTANEVVVDSNFKEPANMLANEIEWSLATGNFNFSKTLQDSYGTPGSEALVKIDLGSGSYDDNTWSSILGFGTDSWIKFEDLTIQSNKLTGSTTLTNFESLDCSKFSLTITNNVESYAGTNQRVNKFILGSLDIVGSITISRAGLPYWDASDGPYNSDQNAAIYNELKAIKIFKGASATESTDGNISIVLPYAVTNIITEIDGTETVDTIEFEAAESASYTDYFLRCVYASSKLVRGIV